MIGHEPTLSETNSRGWTAVCACGWLGVVHNLPGFDPKAPSRQKYRRDAARDNALAEHMHHCEDVRADIAARTDAALKSHAGFMEKSAPIVTRRGRWGAP